MTDTLQSIAIIFLGIAVICQARVLIIILDILKNHEK
jgi:hypothetical protein